LTAIDYSTESKDIVVETLLNLVEKVEEIERQQQEILETLVLEGRIDDDNNAVTASRVTHDAESLL
jgi:hypothetical protein